MLHIEKKQKFDVLVENVARCDLCRRMQGRHKVLSYNNGDINARVVFVGEAPGRLGADRTLVPFCGDQSGKNFEHLLAVAELERDVVFITNAVLCNPRDEKGNNVTPTREEICNCSLHLSLVLDIIEPEFVVPLGQRALDALSVISSHNFKLRRDVCRPMPWTKYVVLPMYHPSPRAIARRSFNNQIRDFYVLGEILERKQPKRHRLDKKQFRLFDTYEPTLLHKVVFHMIEKLGSVSKFKLTKLLYLLDWQEVEATGNVLTGCYYIFQKDGPLATGLSHALDEMDGHELSFSFRGRTPTYNIGVDIRCDMQLPEEVAQKIDIVLAQYMRLTNAQIKTRAYLTEPVKEILRRQQQGERMLNHPIFEGWIHPSSGKDIL